MTAVHLDRLSKHFTFSRGWGKQRQHTHVTAVDQISLSVPTGQAIATEFYTLCAMKTGGLFLSDSSFLGYSEGVVGMVTLQ